MDELRDLYLKSIYWLFWKSADFEADFEEKFPTTYKYLKSGDERLISTCVLEAIFHYALEWVQEY
jgi:hypothetical protein